METRGEKIEDSRATSVFLTRPFQPPLLRKSASIATGCPTSSASERKELNKQGKGDKLPQPVGDNRVMEDVQVPETRLLEESMLFGADGKPVMSYLRSHLVKEGRMSCNTALRLIREGRALLEKEPNLLELDAPVTICGDVHGQFYDLLNMMDEIGPPSKRQYLFLGDYVDRGDFSSEVVLYLLGWKIHHPKSLWMLRGNHESHLMCEFMTFLIECEYKYSEEVYAEFMSLFNALPLAAVIRGNNHGDILCMHGGLSPSIVTLKDIKTIDRYREPPPDGSLCDILWSDPVSEYDPSRPEFEGLTKKEYLKLEYVENDIRHTSYCYGRLVVERFLQKNRLCCIVRAHQVQEEGYMEHRFLNIDRKVPYVYTIFSAANYCDQYENKGAYMVVSLSEIKLKTFAAVSHPFNLPEYIDVFSFSLPYMLEMIVGILQKLVYEMKEEIVTKTVAEEKLLDAQLKEKTKSLLERTKRARERQKAYLRVLDGCYHENMPLFESTLKMDAENEAFPKKPYETRRIASGLVPLRKGVSSPALLGLIPPNYKKLSTTTTQSPEESPAASIATFRRK